MDENEMEYMENLALDVYMEEKLYVSSSTAPWNELPTADDWLI
jgi:hypothetical protein